MTSTDQEIHEILEEMEAESLGDSETELGGDRTYYGFAGDPEDEALDEVDAESELVHELEGGAGAGLGELEDEWSSEGASDLGGVLEDETDMFGELEGDSEGDYFFKKLFRGIGRFVKKAAPILKSVARVAAPMVASAIGGPVGGIVGKLATGFLKEDELAGLGEDEFEGEAELELEVGEAPPTQDHEMEAEQLAAMAAGADSEAEADGMIGASTMATISPRERRALRNVLPHMVRGTVVLSRVLRRRRLTRPAVRTVPTIVRRTSKSLHRRLRSGRPVTRAIAARTMAAHTKRVLARPVVCGRAIARNVRVSSRRARVAAARRRAYR